MIMSEAMHALLDNSADTQTLTENAKKLLNEYRSEVEKLGQKLIKEREARKQTEDASLELLKKVQLKYEQTIEQLRQSIKEQTETNNRLVQQVEEQRKAGALQDKTQCNHQNAATSSMDVSADEFELLRMKLSEAEMSLMRKENELSNLRLDMKIMERDTTRAQDQLRFLRECNRDLKDQLNSIQGANKEQQKKEQEQSDQVQALKHQIDENQRKVDDQQQEFETERRILKDKIQSLEEQCKASKELEKGLANQQGMYEECRRQNESLTFQKRELEQDKQKLSQDVLRLEEQLRKRDESLDKLRLANTKLKAACIEQERQLETYQSMYDGKVDETQKILAENANWILKEQQAKAEIQNLQQKVNELNQTVAEMENKANNEQQHLQKQLELQRERIQLLENALEDESHNSSQYAREVSGLQSETINKEMQLKTLVNDLDKSQRELTLIKEEASRHISTVASLKSQNQTLTKMYDDMKKKYELAKTRICSLLEESDLKDSNFEYEKLRLQETINQQSKLIDYLQSLTEKSGKKHSWFPLIDSKVSKSPLPTNTVDKKAANHVKEIESALERERTKNKVLLEQYNQANIELLDCKKEIKRRLEREAKSIIEQSVNKCSPTKRKHQGIYENLLTTADIKELLGETEERTTPDMSPSAPPASQKDTDIRSTSSRSTAEATETYFMARRSQSTMRTDHNQMEEEFTFTDSILDELAYNK